MHTLAPNWTIANFRSSLPSAWTSVTPAVTPHGPSGARSYRLSSTDFDVHEWAAPEFLEKAAEELLEEEWKQITTVKLPEASELELSLVRLGSVALLGFGLDSGIEAMASIIVIWRFTGTRLASATSERRAQQLVAVSFFLLAPYIAIEAVRALVTGDRAETSIIGLVLTAGTAIFQPALGLAKRRIAARLGSSATAGEGTQNLLCAYLAIAVFAGLAANTLWGA